MLRIFFVPFDNLHRNIFTVFLTYQVGLTGCVVLLRTHPHQAVVVEEDTQRVTGSDEDIESQVKLITLHEKGLFQIFLHNEVIPDRKLLAVPYQRYPATDRFC